jgi:hypothetical protein
MATTVYIPKELLAAVDNRAKELKLNRNRFILFTLKKALSEETSWDPEFLQALDDVEPEEAKVVDAMWDDIKRHRLSKKSIKL